MLFDEYQDEARRTAQRDESAYPKVIRIAANALDSYEASTDLREQLFKLQDVHTWAHGLSGEAGEVCDLLKKVHGHGKPYEPEKLKKELGDVLWYVANLADVHGFRLSEVAEANVAKLRARYPSGFNVADAAAKRDETETGFAFAPDAQLQLDIETRIVTNPHTPFERTPVEKRTYAVIAAPHDGTGSAE